MNNRKNIPFFLLMLLVCTCINDSFAQLCGVSAVPIYSRSCFTEFFTSITATGTGPTTSTIGVSASSCSGITYHPLPTQTISSRRGDTVTLHFTRSTDHYTAYMSVYIDWNNNGIYDPVTELAGGVLQLSPTTLSADYSFIVSYCGIVGSLLPMRVMLSESPAATPCSGNWGETYDFRFNVLCPFYPPLVGMTICVGDTSSLNGYPPCGTWTSLNPGSVGVLQTGHVIGVSGPGATISYQSQGCPTFSAYVGVEPFPIQVQTAGGDGLCYHSTVTVVSVPPGGIWTASPGGMVTLSPTPSAPPSGAYKNVYGIGIGTVTLTYWSPSGCHISRTLSIDTANLTVPPSVCEGSSVYLTGVYDPSFLISGGTWTSSNPAVASIGGTFAYGVAAGTALISYQNANTCYGTKQITVDPLPVVTGASALCFGLSTTLTGSPAGGTWSSSDPTVASVTSAGVVTGVSTGPVTIFYTDGNGCTRTWPMTIGGIPNVTGPVNVCIGSSITLGTTIPGTWSCSDISKATVSGGVVTGISAGSAIVSCISPLGCTGVHNIFVSEVPVISGSSAMTCGTQTTLSASLSGVWNSGNPAVVQIGSLPSPNIATALSTGISIISFTTSYGCRATHAISVTGYSIAGPATVCQAGYVSLSTTGTGGSWTSSAPGIANVYSTGYLHGAAVGTAIISYITGGCYATHTISVLPYITVSGCSAVCVGSNCNLVPSPAVTVYGSSNSAVATVSDLGGGTYRLQGVSAGTATITFGTGLCAAYHSITVNPTPYVTGPTHVCPGMPMTLSASPSGGSWSSDNSSIITVSSSGVVSFVSAGWTYIDYMSPAGCTRNDYAVTAGSGIDGPSVLCAGAPAGHFSGEPSGGTWSCTPSSMGTINTSGVYSHSGVEGTATITYSTPGCLTATRTVTVSDARITGGPTQPCNGFTEHWTSSTSGGTWTSSDGSIAPVNGLTGYLMGGSSSGSSTITYTKGGCTDTRAITMFGSPSKEAWGSCNPCIWGPYGWTNHLAASPTGGTWTASNVNLTVDPDGGGHANSTITPIYGWTGLWGSGDVFYTIIYPGKPSGCAVHWNLSASP